MADQALPDIIRIPVPASELQFRRPLAAGRPIHVPGAMKGRWPALDRWSPEYLTEKVGSIEVQVRNYGENVGVPKHKWKQYCRFDKMTMGEYFRKVAAGEAKHIYLAQVNITKELKALLPDIEKPPFLNFFSLDPVIWIGPGGHVEPLHFDTSHSVIGEVIGKKRVVMYSPEHYRALYPFPFWSPIGVTFSQLDIDHPDLALFPRFKGARAVECTIEAGDILFIPAGWWHQVYCLDHPCISVTHFCERRSDEVFKSFKQSWVRDVESKRWMKINYLRLKAIAARRLPGLVEPPG
jgi:Cupin-like domain